MRVSLEKMESLESEEILVPLVTVDHRDKMYVESSAVLRILMQLFPVTN